MCQSHTGRLTGLWFLPKLAFGLNTNDGDYSVLVSPEDGPIMGWNMYRRHVGNIILLAVKPFVLSLCYYVIKEHNTMSYSMINPTVYRLPNNERQKI